MPHVLRSLLAAGAACRTAWCSSSLSTPRYRSRHLGSHHPPSSSRSSTPGRSRNGVSSVRVGCPAASSAASVPGSGGSSSSPTVVCRLPAPSSPTRWATHTCTTPNLASRASRSSRSAATGRSGTLSESTVSGGAASSPASTAGRTATAESQCRCSEGGQAVSKETASPRQPCRAAVRAAPTVPECSTAWPTLAPTLIPDRTTSGAGSSHPRPATCTMYAGWPSTAQASTPGSPGSSRACTSVRPSSCTESTDVPTPLESRCGAATTTSRPASRAAAASAHRPGESMPSSLVIRARGTCPP